MEFTFGHPGKIAISWFQFLFAFGGMCAYNVIVGDTLPHVLRHIFPSLNPSDDPLMELQWMSWLHFFTSRRMLTLLSTVFITYPLCLYRDISKLAKASAIALIALLVIVLVMAIEAPLVPNSIKGNEELRWNFISSGWVQSIGVISFAFVCHHNTFVIINALKTPTLNRSEAVTHISIIVSVIISVTVAVIGYQTFTDKSRGNILNNFPSEGLLINIARLCFGFNMFTTYPLEHFVAREVLENYYFGEQTSLTVNVLLTTVLVFSSLFISLITCNLGIVLELTGGFSATALAFVLPPAMYIKLASGPILSRKKLPHLICIIFGFCVMILSTTLTLSSAFERWNQGLQQTNKNCHW